MPSISRHGRHIFDAATTVGAALLCAAGGPAGAAPTPSGTQIANTASATFTTDAGPGRIASNTVTLTVDQLVDAAITAAVPSMPAAASVTAVAFVVANPGNGPESYRLSASLDSDQAAVVGLARDTDGDGGYDPARDAVIDDATVSLGPDERGTIFVLVRPASDRPALDRDVAVTATTVAARGSGAPGTVIQGAGANGGDAVVGPTGARASATTLLTAGAAAPTLWKSQSVRAPDGSDRVVPGTIVTYQLEARFPGPVRAPEISDAIPAGLDFVPGTLTLDGAPLSDAADGDPGSFDGAAIRVALGDIAAAGTRTIRFQTKIR